MYDDLERLIDELRKLVGWGAAPHRLPALHALRAALGISPDIPHARAGRMMRRALFEEIHAIEGEFTVARKTVTDKQVQSALEVSFTDHMADAPTRRSAAMWHLGISYSVESWRRATGPEVELLAILAEHLTGGEAVAA